MNKEEYEQWQRDIKSLYAKLYAFGLNAEQVRSKLDKLSQFFGNISGVSNIVKKEEIIAIGDFLDTLKNLKYKF